MEASDRPLLILGLGNILLRDEGVGVHLAVEMEKRQASLPPRTDVVDGGTLGIELLPLVADSRALLLLDAAQLYSAPGAIRLFEGAAVQGVFGGHLSPHQAGAGDLVAVAALTGALPAAVAMIGIQPGSVEYGLELTPVLESALPDAVAAAIDAAWNLDRMVGHA